MRVGLDTVSKLIVITGSLTLDGVIYTDEVDCREITGEHELIVDGEFDFIPMGYADHEYVKDRLQEQINQLTVEVLQMEYQLTTGEVL